MSTNARAMATAASARAPALPHSFEYDVIVIGGGSGGLACAREIAALGGKALLYDYTHASGDAQNSGGPPSSASKWGLGGTCVNVGCIPKKLMHYAAGLGQGMHDAAEFGWAVAPAPVPAPGAPPHRQIDWNALTAAVHSYIRGTNFGYKNTLRDERVQYVNGLARVVDAHTIEASEVPKKGAPPSMPTRHTAAHIVIAVGGRPRYPADVEGAQALGISSDELFWMKHAPGKTLLVGAGYVALECAGFLTHIGFDATVMVRGQVLRGFDQSMADKIVAGMEMTGTRFLRSSRPLRLEASSHPHSCAPDKKRVRVHYSNGKETVIEEFDTVIFATGRAPVTEGLGLKAVGVRMDSGGKILGSNGVAAGTGEGSATIGASLQRVTSDLDPHSETSSVPSIHAIGDVLSGTPELTPVAIRAGKLLAKRIMNGVHPVAPSSAPPALPTRDVIMDYGNVPTTIFTPTEYACVGLSEEEATRKHGVDGVDVYHLAYDTLELSVAHRVDTTGMPLPPQCYAKVIVRRCEHEPVLGIHILGPHAGEIMQGFAVAFRKGLTRADLESTIGIHPTHAEELVLLDRTVRSGRDFMKTSC